MDINDEPKVFELSGYAGYMVRITRRQALRALLYPRRRYTAKLRCNQVSGIFPVTVHKVQVTMWGGGGSGNRDPGTDQDLPVQRP
jgi:hypothetical protein